MKIIADCTTGEVIEREMTDKEIKAETAEQALSAGLEADTAQAEAAKATSKAALLAKLGITAEEATLLLS